MLADEIRHNFGDLVIVGTKSEKRHYTTWYVECDQCQGRHIFRKQGPKVWHTSCVLSGVEWTVTPADYYIQKRCNLTKILGEV